MPEHVMSIESLMTHLNRCKATNKHMFKSCMYNCLHVIPKEKYDEHVESNVYFIKTARISLSTIAISRCQRKRRKVGKKVL